MKIFQKNYVKNVLSIILFLILIIFSTGCDSGNDDDSSDLLLLLLLSSSSDIATCSSDNYESCGVDPICYRDLSRSEGEQCWDSQDCEGSLLCDNTSSLCGTCYVSEIAVCSNDNNEACGSTCYTDYTRDYGDICWDDYDCAGSLLCDETASLCGTCY